MIKYFVQGALLFEGQGGQRGTVWGKLCFLADLFFWEGAVVFLEEVTPFGVLYTRDY